MTYTARWTNFVKLNLESIRDFCQRSSFPVKDRDPSHSPIHCEIFLCELLCSVYLIFKGQKRTFKVIHDHMINIPSLFLRSMALEVINWVIWSLIVREAVRVVAVRVAIVRFFFVMNSTLTPQSKQKESCEKVAITQKLQIPL